MRDLGFQSKRSCTLKLKLKFLCVHVSTDLHVNTTLCKI